MAELLLSAPLSQELVLRLPGITTCDPNFNMAQVGGIIRWTPVKNLTFSAEVTYTMLDQKFEGTITPAAAFNTIAKPAAIYQLKDQDTVQASCPRSA